MDILGLPHAIMITTANVTDRNGAIDMVDYYCDITDNLSLIKKVLVDGGYTGQNFADEIKRISNAEVEVVKRNELHTFSVIPKRWIVERSFGWLDKCRRLWKNCERLLQNSFQMISLAFIRIILKSGHLSKSEPTRFGQRQVFCYNSFYNAVLRLINPDFKIDTKSKTAQNWILNMKKGGIRTTKVRFKTRKIRII